MLGEVIFTSQNNPWMGVMMEMEKRMMGEDVNKWVYSGKGETRFIIHHVECYGEWQKDAYDEIRTTEGKLDRGCNMMGGE